MFASKIILFSEALQFKTTIIPFYNQQTWMKIPSHVPLALTWHRSQIIIDVLSWIVNVCVLNPISWAWLLSNVLHATITMTLKFKEKFGITPSMDNLMEDDYSLELSMLASKIRKELCEVLNGSSPFLKKYEGKKGQ